jgi:hypothetical protein
MANPRVPTVPPPLPTPKIDLFLAAAPIPNAMTLDAPQHLSSPRRPITMSRPQTHPNPRRCSPLPQVVRWTWREDPRSMSMSTSTSNERFFCCLRRRNINDRHITLRHSCSGHVLLVKCTLQFVNPAVADLMLSAANHAQFSLPLPSPHRLTCPAANIPIAPHPVTSCVAASLVFSHDTRSLVLLPSPSYMLLCVIFASCPPCAEGGVGW